MRFIQALAMAACVASGGCGPDRDAIEAPSVSDDPGQIAEVRKLRAQEEDAAYNTAFEELRELGIIVSRGQKALERREDRARADLARIMEDLAATDELRARAARCLVALGDRSGVDFLLEAVRVGQGRRRLAALQALDDWDPARRVDLGPPERARLVLACLDDPDPDVVRATATLCAAREIPGTEGKLVGLLEAGKARDPLHLAHQLARIVRSPEAVRVMLDHLLRDRPAEHRPWTGSVLERLIHSPDPKIAEPVRVAFLRYTLGYTGPSRYDQAVVRDLGGVADRTTIPVLEDILANARDPISREYALEALARLDPGRAVDRALALSRAEPRYELATSTLRKYASEKDADRIIEAIPGTRARAGRSLTLEETRLLIDRLGPRGRRVVEEAMDRLPSDARMWATWKLKGLTLDAAIDDLRDAGIIKMNRDAVLAAMRRARETAEVFASIAEPRPIDHSAPDELYAALGEAGVLTMFDVETDELPCRHDELVMGFAEHSNGVFQPECAVQTWHRKDKEDNDAPYTVRFLQGGRLYRFGAENHGDWYDVKSVHRALNFALETAGRKERFLGLEIGGQAASFVFADPAAFRPIAAKYGLSLADDPDSAMRRGKEFERRVIEKTGSEQDP